MTHDEQHTLQTIATAGADAVNRWRASKQALRASRYRQRMEGKSDNLSDLAPAWLSAVERDDRTDALIPVLEELPKSEKVAEQVTA